MSIQVVLLPCPRRFGKSLNLSMLRYFVAKADDAKADDAKADDAKADDDRSHLFQDLSIWRAGDTYREHFQRYPVIALTFKDIKVDLPRFGGHLKSG